MLVTVPAELEVAAVVWARSLLVTEAARELDREEGLLVSLHPNEVLLAPVVSEKSYSLIEDRKYSFKVHRTRTRPRSARPSSSCSTSTSRA